MLIDLMLSLIICLALMLLVCFVRRLVFRPVRPGKHILITVRLCVSGEAPELEQVVISKATLLAGSFEEGEQGESGTGEGNIDPTQGL